MAQRQVELLYRMPKKSDGATEVEIDAWRRRMAAAPQPCGCCGRRSTCRRHEEYRALAELYTETLHDLQRLGERGGCKMLMVFFLSVLLLLLSVLLLLLLLSVCC